MAESDRTRLHRRVVAALLLLLLLALWLLLRLMSADEPASQTETRPDEAAPRAATPPDSEPKRVRDRLRSEAAPASEPAPAAAPTHVDGWPAADIVVRRPGGNPAPGAVVYLHVAGEGCGDRPLDLVARRSADNEGRVRFPVATAGRYDVGAREVGGFTTLVRDVEFPAARTVEIVLPEMAVLGVRADGELPPNAWITIAPSGARVCAFPGRGESTYAQIATRATRVDVPRGVPMRVSTSGGVIAEPAEVVAPGTITLRAGFASDGRVDVPVEFEFVGGKPPDHGYAVELTVDAPGAEKPGPHVFSIGATAGRRPSRARAILRAPPGPLELRLTVSGQPTTTATVVAAAGATHMVPVTVISWTASDSGFRARWTTTHAAPPETARVLAGHNMRQRLRANEQGSITMSPLGPIAALADDVPGAVFVSPPVTPKPGESLTLPLAAAARVVVKMDRPPALDPSWPYTVERADGQPFVAGDGVRVTANAEQARTIVLAAGDVELVFQFAGRETGRRTVRVVAGPPIEVQAPDVVPAGR